MNKTLKIAVREYNVTVRTKGFIIGLILAPVLFSGSLIAMILFEDKVDTTDKTIVLLDSSGVVAPIVEEKARERNETALCDEETGKQVRPAYLIERVAPDPEEPERQKLALSDRVRNKEITAFVVIGAGVRKPWEDPGSAFISYHSENSLFSDERGWLSWNINDYLHGLRIRDAGLPEQEVRNAFQPIEVKGLGLVSLDKKTGEVEEPEATDEGKALGVPLAMVMLMFMMMMFGAMPLLNSVLEEKMQKIAEVLLGSISPFDLMMGKLLGGVGVALTGLIVYVAAGIIASNCLEWEQYVPYDVLPWFFIYMVSATFMFGALLSAVGAACSEAKEAQSLMPFIMLPMMIPMFVLIPVLKEPLGGFATGMSFVPFFTPMLMLLRQSTQSTIPAWQPWVGLAGVIFTTIFIVWVSGRIFRVGILMQGKPPKIKDLLRWAVRG